MSTNISYKTLSYLKSLQLKQNNLELSGADAYIVELCNIT
jgi:hypothetical protein